MSKNNEAVSKIICQLCLCYIETGWHPGNTFLTFFYIDKLVNEWKCKFVKSVHTSAGNAYFFLIKIIKNADCKQRWDKIVHKMRKYALKGYVQVANCKLWITPIELLCSRYRLRGEVTTWTSEATLQLQSGYWCAICLRLYYLHIVNILFLTILWEVFLNAHKIFSPRRRLNHTWQLPVKHF